jgi:hypothetical protein
MEVSILSPKDLKHIVSIIILVVCLPVIIPIIFFAWIITSIFSPIYESYLKKRVYSEWYPQGKCLLFVYSDSPVWKDYIETNIIPKISESAAILNWSERVKWALDSKLEVKVFKKWAGVNLFEIKKKLEVEGRDYNPIAILFEPGGQVKVIRFWIAFKEYKHGKIERLKEIENEFFQTLSDIKKEPSMVNILSKGHFD